MDTALFLVFVEAVSRFFIKQKKKKKKTVYNII